MITLKSSLKSLLDSGARVTFSKDDPDAWWGSHIRLDVYWPKLGKKLGYLLSLEEWNYSDIQPDLALTQIEIEFRNKEVQDALAAQKPPEKG